MEVSRTCPRPIPHYPWLSFASGLDDGELDVTCLSTASGARAVLSAPISNRTDRVNPEDQYFHTMRGARSSFGSLVGLLGVVLMTATMAHAGCYYSISWWGTHNGDAYALAPSPYTPDTPMVVMPSGDAMHISYSFGSCSSTWSEIRKDGEVISGTTFTASGLYELHMVTFDYDVRKAWYLEISEEGAVAVQDGTSPAVSWFYYDPAGPSIRVSIPDLPPGTCQATLFTGDGRILEQHRVTVASADQPWAIPVLHSGAGVCIVEVAAHGRVIRKKLLID